MYLSLQLNLTAVPRTAFYFLSDYSQGKFNDIKYAVQLITYLYDYRF